MSYALARLTEGNTWAGIGAAITSGFALDAPMFVRFLIAGCGVAAILIPEKS